MGTTEAQAADGSGDVGFAGRRLPHILPVRMQHTDKLLPALQARWCHACRLARVVAWLEELAGLELDRAEAAAQAAGGSGAAFAAGEGTPRETAARLQQRSVLAQMQRLDARTLVSELDPDAPTRYPVHKCVTLCKASNARQDCTCDMACTRSALHE